jgi:aryl-alcohol dehydrogenase-like predicted oxidoreductase
MNASRALWGVDRFDLMQIHNMLDWAAHIETLKEWKAQGRIRYIGMTTSHGERHDALLKVMAEQPLDFVQFTYNVLDREAEKRLLPLAADRGLAVIINRPFRQGALIDAVRRHRLPEWAREIDCANWAQFLLKFVVSHPAVTCVIPATSRVDHMRENMGALHGRLPDPPMRARMIRTVEAL